MLSTEELTGVIEELELGRPDCGMIAVNLDTVFQIPEETGEKLTVSEPSKLIPVELSVLPTQRRVVALDATSMTLGRGENAIVGAVRGSIVEKSPEEAGFKIQNYGPYLVCYSNQNREDAYNRLRAEIFHLRNRSKAPGLGKMIDRTRNFLEKHLQYEVAENYQDSLLLFDGSLTVGPIDSPKRHFDRVTRVAANNNNDIVSVSKHTTLTLKGTEESILSPLAGIPGPCYCDVKPHLSSRSTRYGPIRLFTAKLTRNGEPFRVDIPLNSPREPVELLSETAGLAGTFGYPEELRVAHIACILSSLEVLELQAAAVKKYNLELKEEVRKKIFGPWG